MNTQSAIFVHDSPAKAPVSETECQRCGKTLRTSYPPQWRLPGNYYAILCPDCLNEWHRNIREHDDYKELRILEIRFNQVSQKVAYDGDLREDQLLVLDREMDELRARLNRLAARWCLPMQTTAAA